MTWCGNVLLVYMRTGEEVHAMQTGYLQAMSQPQFELAAIQPYPVDNDC